MTARGKLHPAKAKALGQVKRGNSKQPKRTTGHPQKAKKPRKEAVKGKTLVHEAEHDEVEVGDEDVDFFEEHQVFASSFIDSNIESAPTKKDGKKKRRLEQPQAETGRSGLSDTANAAAEETKQADAETAEPQKSTKRNLVEDEVEKRQRRQPSTVGWITETDIVKTKDRLPIKTIDGTLVRRSEEVKEDDQSMEGLAGNLPQDGVVGSEESEPVQKMLGEQDAGDAEGATDDDEEEGDEDEEYYHEPDGFASEDDVVLPARHSSAAPKKDLVAECLEAARGLSLSSFGGDVRAMGQARLGLKKAKIATLCEDILEDPDESLMKHTVPATSTHGPRSRVQALLSLLEDDDVVVQELALMSALAVFKDIIPAYRIRLPTEKERAQRVSKEVKRMWDFERTFLAAYQTYLKHLERVSKKAGGGTGPTHRLGLLAVRSMCDLLTTQTHFNFITNILSAVIRLAMRSKGDEPLTSCCAAVKRLFETDQQGQVSLEAARMICNEVKARKLVAPDQLVRTLAHLKLRVKEDDVDDIKRRADAEASARKKRKRDGGGGGGDEEDQEEGKENDRRDILAGLKEAEARADPLLRARCQAETLQEVTLLYFRVLKAAAATGGKRMRGPAALLPASLEGLSKIAHLINLDTVLDLIDVLKSLFGEDNDDYTSADHDNRRTSLPLEACLHAVLTALRTLQGPGRELKVDDKAFVVYLYQQLDRVVQRTKQQLLTLLLTCVRIALMERREYSTARVAGFYKRLSSLAMQLASPRETRALLAMVHELAIRYPGLDQLQENEADRVTMGVYRPDISDPEMSNPLAAACWELTMLKQHVHPQVRVAATAAMAGARGVTGRGVDALAIARDPEEVEGKAMASWFIRMPRANPLHNMIKRAERERRGKKRMFFVQKVSTPATVDGTRALTDLAAADVEDGVTFRDYFKQMRTHERKVRLSRSLTMIKAQLRAYGSRSKSAKQ